MTTAARALARGAWLEQFNRGWRFSRFKAGLWLLIGQLGLAALVVWRLAPSPGTVPLMQPAVSVVTLGIFGAFVMGLLRGREELYGRSVLRALHVSPASGAGILTGLALATVAPRLPGSLLVAGVAGWLLPAGGLWWAVPVLWALALVSGLAGYGAALLALVGWVRVTPRSLALLWGLSVTLGLNLIIALMGILTLGLPATAVAAALRAAATAVAGGAGALAVLPWLVMAVWAARRRERAGDWYREAYLNMQELGDSRSRLRPSRWPRVLPGAAGALQARQWREIWLNWFTWIRLAVMLLLPGLVIWRPHTLATMTDRYPALVLMGLGLASVLGAFGELLATVGSSDGPNIGLSMVAGVRAGQIVKAKWVALLPFALLSAACTWAIALALGRPGWAPALAAGCIGLGFGVIAMAGGLFDLDPHAEVTEQDVPEILRAALEQMPRKMGGVIGYAGGLFFAIAAVWLCGRLPDAVLPAAVGCAALAHLALAAGYRRLKRMGM